MGTSSRIGIVKSNKIVSIYVHLDGYYKGVGEFLLEHMKTEEKTQEFLSKGDRQSVENEEYYDGTIQVDVSLAAFLSSGLKQSCEFFYLMENGKWVATDSYPENGFFTFNPLETLVLKEE